jgi:hypothetical protein
MASRLVRVSPVTVNDVLDGHVKLDLECLDRLYLHGYLGQLQVGGQVSGRAGPQRLPLPLLHLPGRIQPQPAVPLRRPDGGPV